MHYGSILEWFIWFEFRAQLLSFATLQKWIIIYKYWNGLCSEITFHSYLIRFQINCPFSIFISTGFTKIHSSINEHLILLDNFRAYRGPPLPAFLSKVFCVRTAKQAATATSWKKPLVLFAFPTGLPYGV